MDRAILEKRGTWQLFESVGDYDLSQVYDGGLDSRGRLWLRLPDQLLCTDGAHVIALRDLPPRAKASLIGVRQGGFTVDDRYWQITEDNRLFSVALEDGTLEEHTDNLPPLDDAYWMWISAHTDILVGTPGELIRYDGEKAVTFTVPADEEGRLHAATLSPSGDLWMTSHLGVHHCVDGECRMAYEVETLFGKNSALWEIRVTQDGAIWLPSNHGVCRIVGDDISTEKKKAWGQYTAINPLLLDAEENLWVALPSTGIGVVSHGDSVLFAFDETPGVGWPKSAVQDQMGAFWFVGAGNGMWRYDPHTIHVARRGYMEAATWGGKDRALVAAGSGGVLDYQSGGIVQHHLGAQPRRRFLGQARDERLWIAMTFGLAAYDLRAATLEYSDDIQGCNLPIGRSIACMTVDHDDAVWMACRQAVYCYHDGKTTAYEAPGIGVDRSGAMLTDAANRVWLATSLSAPLFRFSGEAFVPVVDEICEGAGVVSCLLETADGDIWIGSSRGQVFRYRTQAGKIERVMQLEKAPEIRNIRIDDHGTAWLATSRGLCVSDWQHTYCMTERCLLPSRATIATWELENEAVLVVSERGISEYTPNRQQRPEVFVSRISADETYERPVSLALTEGAAVVDIFLGAVNMKPGPLRYQVRMRGYEEDWTETWEEEVRYEKLPAGNYTFEVRAFDQDLATCETPASVDIEVVPDTREEEIAELKGELRGAQDFAASIIRSINDAIIVLDVDGLITTTNYATRNLLGHTESDLVNQPASMLFPGSGPCLLDASGIERLKKLSRFAGRERDLMTSRGDSVPVLLSASCMYDSHHEVQGFVVVASDLSEYKSLQGQLLQSQKLESLGVLAGGIAHDFNNLLGVMIGNAELIRSNITKESEKEVCLDDIIKAGQQAAKLCGEMLAYAGKDQTVKMPVNLSQIVQHNADLLRSSIPRKVEIECDFAESLPAVSGDEVQLTQIVMNLVTNAAEAIGDENGVVAITTTSGTFTQAELRSDVYPEVPEPGEYVVLEVRDTGCGMDRETMRHIFDPFYTTKFTGRGLGLSAIHGIIKSHGGGMTLESEPGKGSVFRVFLPVSEEAYLAEAQEDRPVHEQAYTGTVLVVDDEEPLLAVAVRCLESLGFECLTAGDGEEAVAKLQQSPPGAVGLVFLDVTMPRMDGIEAFSLMRQLRSDLPIVINSGYSEKQISERFPDDENLHFLHKPYSLDKIRTQVEEVLKGR